MSLVLGLEHSCPLPREGLSSERLSLAFALASSLVSSTTPLFIDQETTCTTISSVVVIFCRAWHLHQPRDWPIDIFVRLPLIKDENKIRSSNLCKLSTLLTAEVESSRTHFNVLVLGLKASSPRKLPCPRLEDSSTF